MADPTFPPVIRMPQSEKDPLTGLGTRYRFIADLERLLDAPGARPGDGALILIDIDDSRKTNDTYGYRFGDRVIRGVGELIAGILPAGATMYRIGGDTFAVLWPGASREQTHHFSVTLLSEARKPRRVAGVTCTASVSVGAAFFPEDSDTAESLFRCADITLFRVKRRGKNNVSFFSADDHDQALSHIDLESELRASVEAGFKDFEIYYQPTVDAVSGICNGAEALLRWTSPKNIRISPADVIMHLELIGCVEQGGDWVLEQAIGQCAAWRASGLSDFSIHVNLSMLQLRDHVLEDRLVSMLASSGLPPSSLVLEVTESAIMNDLSNSIAILNDIRRHGVRIALDDFGSGYSSINYLRKLRSIRSRSTVPLLRTSRKRSTNLLPIRSRIWHTVFSCPFVTKESKTKRSSIRLNPVKAISFRGIFLVNRCRSISFRRSFATTDATWSNARKRCRKKVCSQRSPSMEVDRRSFFLCR
jgi:diguanylate cyclase (GGDEF)-like protein